MFPKFSLKLWRKNVSQSNRNFFFFSEDFFSLPPQDVFIHTYTIFPAIYRDRSRGSWRQWRRHSRSWSDSSGLRCTRARSWAIFGPGSADISPCRIAPARWCRNTSRTTTAPRRSRARPAISADRWCGNLRSKKNGRSDEQLDDFVFWDHGVRRENVGKIRFLSHFYRSFVLRMIILIRIAETRKRVQLETLFRLKSLRVHERRFRKTRMFPEYRER